MTMPTMAGTLIFTVATVLHHPLDILHPSLNLLKFQLTYRLGYAHPCLLI
jgi:hypothetical protein